MKANFQSFCLLSLFGILIFASCKKDDAAGSNTPAEENALFSLVQGKWNAGVSSGRKQNSQHIASLKEMDTPQLISIEFLSDTTYIVLMTDDIIYTGHFNITDSSTIELSKFGKLTEIKIATSSMNFKLSLDNTTISVSANKAEEMPATDNTKLICRNWLLTRHEIGQEIYDDAEEGTDRITVLFSKAGTYLVQYLGKDTVYAAEAANWKWHPSVPNAFIYWWGDEEPREKDKVIITELSESSLKMTESYYDYTLGADYNPVDSTLITEKYVLVPASQSSGRISASTASGRRISADTGQKGIFRRHF